MRSSEELATIHVSPAPSAPAQRWGQTFLESANGKTQTVEARLDSQSRLRFGKQAFWERLHSSAVLNRKAASAAKVYTVSWVTLYMALAIFVVGSTYTIGRTVQFQGNYDDNVEAAASILKPLDSGNYGDNLDVVAKVSLHTSNAIANDALIAQGWAAASLPNMSKSTFTADDMALQRRIWASVAWAESGKSVTGDEVIQIFSAIFCILVLASAVARMISAKNDKTIATRISEAYGELKHAIEHDFPGAKLYVFDIDADDTPRLLQMVCGGAMLVVGWIVAGSDPSVGLPLAAVGAVVIHFGLSGSLRTITEVNESAYQFVMSILKQAEGEVQRLREAEPDRRLAINLPKHRGQVEEIRVLFLNIKHIL